MPRSRSRTLIKKSKVIESNFVRVRSDKLDELITLVGELVIASAGTSLAARRAADVETIEAASTMGQMVEDVRDRALKLRMVPIARPSAASPASPTTGTGTRQGHRTGADAAPRPSSTSRLVEKITDPLMPHREERDRPRHRVRRDAERARQAARRRLQLNAYHDSGSIVIEVADDGGGLDHKRILARAVERGLLAPGHTPSDEEIHRLIMQSGFSTASAVTTSPGAGSAWTSCDAIIESLARLALDRQLRGSGHDVFMRLRLPSRIIGPRASSGAVPSYVVRSRDGVGG